MTTTNTKLDLDAIEARVKAATPGPWTVEPHGMTDALYAGRTDKHHGLRLMNLDDWDSNGDANVDFITHARTDIPALIAEVRRLKAPLFKRVTRMAETRGLTKREAEVLELLVQAYTNKDIGVRLGIADSTVEIHVSRVIHKSKCASRAEVIVAAYTGVVP